MQPQKRMKKNNWIKNGVATHLQLPTMVTHKFIWTPLLIHDTLCDISFSNLWEDHDDVKEIDDTICSLDDLSLCGDSIDNYTVESTFDACKYYERWRDKSPLYVSMLFKMKATGYYMHWLPFSCFYLFIYKMPMHRKRVRLKS